MAAQGGVVFQEKVRRLLSRKNGKPVLKSNKPLVLKDAVGNCQLKKAEATCITEMAVLVACWKRNNFVDSLCSDEVNAFYKCVKAQAAMKNKSEQTSLQGGRMQPKEATTLLKRYPNLHTEI